MQEVGFEELDMYVLRRQNMVGQYIATQSILDLCEETLQSLGTCVTKMLWEQEVMGLVGSQAEVEASGRGVVEDMDTEAENYIRRLSSI